VTEEHARNQLLCPWFEYHPQKNRKSVYWFIVCRMVSSFRAVSAQIFLWLLYVSSAWFPFYDFILSLTKLFHTWLLINLTQVAMNTRKKLRLTWDLSPRTSISVFDKRYMAKTYTIQACIEVYFMSLRQQKFSFLSHRLISLVRALY